MRRHLELLVLDLIGKTAAENPDQPADNEECTRRKQHQAIRLIPAAIGDGWQNSDTEQGSRSKQLTQRTDRDENHAISQTIANPIQKARRSEERRVGKE